MSRKIITALLLLWVLLGGSTHGATASWLFNRKLSIIIDDMGYNEILAHRFISLRLPLDFSFLPDAPYSPSLSKKFCKMGFTVMIHMPSQPLSYPGTNPGKDAIYVNTPPQKVWKLLRRAKRKLPCASGLDNHEGSRLLQDRKQMSIIMMFLRKHHMFFVDSMTTPKSIGAAEAKKYHVPYAVRLVFLDDYKNVKYITEQINKAIALLSKYNSVVAIGHCNWPMYEALKKNRKKLEKYMIDVKYVLR